MKTIVLLVIAMTLSIGVNAQKKKTIPIDVYGVVGFESYLGSSNSMSLGLAVGNVTVGYSTISGRFHYHQAGLGQISKIYCANLLEVGYIVNIKDQPLILVPSIRVGEAFKFDRHKAVVSPSLRLLFGTRYITPFIGINQLEGYTRGNFGIILNTR